jgi:hypothetical protein
MKKQKFSYFFLFFMSPLQTVWENKNGKIIELTEDRNKICILTQKYSDEYSITLMTDLKLLTLCYTTWFDNVSFPISFCGIFNDFKMAFVFPCVNELHYFYLRIEPQLLCIVYLSDSDCFSAVFRIILYACITVCWVLVFHAG